MLGGADIVCCCVSWSQPMMGEPDLLLSELLSRIQNGCGRAAGCRGRPARACVGRRKFSLSQLETQHKFVVCCWPLMVIR